MTTFKNNSKYAELIFTYLELASANLTPLTPEEVLERFQWRFKGGKMQEVARGTRLSPVTSPTVFPDGTCGELLEDSPGGFQFGALMRIARTRVASGRLRTKGIMARVGTYMMLTCNYENQSDSLAIYSGMRSIYHLFGRIWEWAGRRRDPQGWELFQGYTRELVLGSSVVSRVDLKSADKAVRAYDALLETSRLSGLLEAVREVKGLIRMMTSTEARKLALETGKLQAVDWAMHVGPDCSSEADLDYDLLPPRVILWKVGPLMFRVSQRVCMNGTQGVRYALGMSDVERLHQLLMSTASAIVGTCAQASVGTPLQKVRARMAVEVVQSNISRIVATARKIPLGDEVLVCKGYRRAYTAYLGVMAGPLCVEETKVLIEEAEQTAAEGVLDVQGFLEDAGRLDAASALNACKVFKICPAPDVSPGGAMIDRVKQIGDGNEVDQTMMAPFEEELRTQILRAYIRAGKGRLKLRSELERPMWYTAYMKGEFSQVPSAEIHTYLEWEGTATMPEVSIYDPANWKDSGIGADTVRESQRTVGDKRKSNMITRLLFDDTCPMPGGMELTSDRVIKFFLKAEGHKDPARGIFSANLQDRQAQSWMEKAVDSVAKKHPSYMIGQEVDAREAKVMQLTAMPREADLMALYYSFDISGWSAKMPAETQRISHELWGKLYGGHLFDVASSLNEGAHIYLNIDGYQGWFKNTHANLEGFNGKEMTMVLVALLSLSVKRWREKVAEAEIMTRDEANAVSALLFAYIDDGLSRIDLPRRYAVAAFDLYKKTVIETFSRCGFTVEVSKCFPSDRFSIFLNEVYVGGRHVVHGVRAAMGISSEPTERHTSLVERVTTVSTGVRGAVMAGLNPLSATILLAYHVLLHLEEWVKERDPVILAIWSLTPRSWAGLGLPNMLQLFVSGSGAAFEEGIATLQGYGRINAAAMKVFITLSKTPLRERESVAILTAPLSGHIEGGYMVDSKVAVYIRRALQRAMEEGILSEYAGRLLKYADTQAFGEYAEAVVARDRDEVVQEQMLNNLAEAHPHNVFSSFARRVEKSMTVVAIVGSKMLVSIITSNREEALISVDYIRVRATK